MRRSVRRGLLALVVSLVLVGIIRSAIPDFFPDEYEIQAVANGVHSDAATVELLDLTTASAVSTADEWSEAEFTAADGAVIVLARVRLIAHGGMFNVRSQLRTDDGYSYHALSVYGFPQPGIVHVGMALTTTLIYEVPVDKLNGKIAIHGSGFSGLQPVAPVMMFELPPDLRPARAAAVVEADLQKPVR